MKAVLPLAKSLVTLSYVFSKTGLIHPPATISSHTPSTSSSTGYNRRHCLTPFIKFKRSATCLYKINHIMSIPVSHKNKIIPFLVGLLQLIFVYKILTQILCNEYIPNKIKFIWVFIPCLPDEKSWLFVIIAQDWKIPSRGQEPSTYLAQKVSQSVYS